MNKTRFRQAKNIRVAGLKSTGLKSTSAPFAGLVSALLIFNAVASNADVLASNLRVGESCPSSLSEKHMTDLIKVPPTEEVLQELVQLRFEINRANREKVFSVARALARQFDAKLSEAVKIGISPAALKPFMASLKKSNLDADAIEQERSRKAIEAERAIKVWKELSEIELGRFGDSPTFSPDSTRVFTSSSKDAQISELPSGRIVSTLKGEWISRAMFSPDGLHVLTTNGRNNKPEDLDAFVWDVKTGQVLKRLQLHKGLVAYAVYSPDGKLILTAAEDQSVALWDAASGALLYQRNFDTKYFDKPEFSTDGSTFFLPHHDQVDVVDTKTGDTIHTLHAGSRMVSLIVRKTEILTAGQDGQIRIFGYPDYREIFKFEVSGGGPLSSVELDKDGSKILALDDDYSGGLWDVNTGKRLPYLDISKARSTFSPDGKQIFIGFLYGESTRDNPKGKPSIIVDAETGQLVSVIKGLNDFPSVGYTPNGQFLLTTAKGQTHSKIWTRLPVGDEPR